jgi:hypothetical protein
MTWQSGALAACPERSRMGRVKRSQSMRAFSPRGRLGEGTTSQPAEKWIAKTAASSVPLKAGSAGYRLVERRQENRRRMLADEKA